MTKKVLVVDDDALLAKIIGNSLTRRGYQVHIAYNGREAVEAYTRFTADCILLDIFMPVLDGFETLQEIKKINPAAKVITMSGMFLDLGYLEITQELGANGWIKKPFELDQLIHGMESMCLPQPGSENSPAPE